MTPTGHVVAIVLGVAIWIAAFVGIPAAGDDRTLGMTVMGYVSTVMRKLACDNRTQAGLIAYAAGLAGIDGPAA